METSTEGFSMQAATEWFVVVEVYTVCVCVCVCVCVFLFVYIFPCVYIHTCTRLLQRSQTQLNYPSRDAPTLTLSPSSLPHHTPSHPTPNTFASSHEPDVKKAMSSGGALTTHSQPLKSRSIISTSYIIHMYMYYMLQCRASCACTYMYIRVYYWGGGGNHGWRFLRRHGKP